MKLQLIFGAQKYELEIPDPNMEAELSSFYAEVAEDAETSNAPSEEWTVGRLKEAVEHLTQVPATVQRLILRGKTLSSDVQPLRALHLKEGDKLMVLGSAKPTSEEDETAAALSRVEKESVDELRARLATADSTLKGLESGFLPKEQWPASQKELDKRLKLANEECMRALLSLDGITAHNETQRRRRKDIVLQVQELLNFHDNLVERLGSVIAEAAR